MIISVNSIGNEIPAGNKSTDFNFTISVSEAESHNLYYYFKWGDDTTSGWIGEYAYSETVLLKHIWQTQGTYTIEAKAKDIYGAESDWATLEVEMPVNQQVINPLLQTILERFPNAFPILRYILGLQ
jgi:hypothetical protein